MNRISPKANYSIFNLCGTKKENDNTNYFPLIEEIIPHNHTIEKNNFDKDNFKRVHKKVTKPQEEDLLTNYEVKSTEKFNLDDLFPNSNIEHHSPDKNIESQYSYLLYLHESAKMDSLPSTPRKEQESQTKNQGFSIELNKLNYIYQPEQENLTFERKFTIEKINFRSNFTSTTSEMLEKNNVNKLIEIDKTILDQRMDKISLENIDLSLKNEELKCCLNDLKNKNSTLSDEIKALKYTLTFQVEQNKSTIERYTKCLKENLINISRLEKDVKNKDFEIKNYESTIILLKKDF